MRLLLILFLFLSIGTSLSAQPPGPGDGAGDPPCWPPPCVPIDGGLSLLLAAGLAYGGKKALDLSKRMEE